MQEECDFQTTLEKKLSAEGRLDVAASSTNLSETEIKKLIPKDSSVDFEILSASSFDVLARTSFESQNDDQANKSTLESIPEVDNEDDCNWLSYVDCNTLFDATCENLSYYNSTKAEKDSDSDMDDTLIFDDAEEGEPMTLDENDSYCMNSDFQRSFEDACSRKLDNLDEMTNDNPIIVSDKVSLIGINRDPSENDRNGNNVVDCDPEVIQTKEEEGKIAENEESIEGNSVDIEEVRNEEKMSDSFDFSSDSGDEHERNLVYSSPNVNISAYFKFRDSMKEPEFEATLEKGSLVFPNKEINGSLILEEIDEESIEKDKKTTTSENETKDPCTEEPRTEGNFHRKILTENARSDQQGKGTKFVELNSPEEYLEKLAEITEPDCPKTEEEVEEKLKRIAESKAKIENRKNEALKNLSMEFNEFAKLMAETKSTEQYNSDSDESLDESKETDNIELPLTKEQVAESFKINNARKDTEEEEKRRAESLQQCFQVIARNGEEFVRDKVEGEKERENKKSEIWKDLGFNKIEKLFMETKDTEDNKNSNDGIEIPSIGQDKIVEGSRFENSQNEVYEEKRCVEFLEECLENISEKVEIEVSVEDEATSKIENNLGNIIEEGIKKINVTDIVEERIEENFKNVIEEKMNGNFESITEKVVEQNVEIDIKHIEGSIKNIAEKKVERNLEDIIKEEIKETNVKDTVEKRIKENFKNSIKIEQNSEIEKKIEQKFKNIGAKEQNFANTIEKKIDQESKDSIVGKIEQNFENITADKIVTNDAVDKSEETISDTKSASETVIKGIVQDIMEDTEDSIFWQYYKQQERTYIKGKVYDFDPKKHGVRMTEEFLKKHCKQNKLYQTPHLNDVLYLHYKGFSFIENLEKYTGLRCLWLENNGIREIANLENQSELKCLYIHNNLISKIENLEWLTKLDTLNLSYNTIRRIENLDSLKFLNTLNLSHNYLQDTGDIEHLRLLDSLSVLDISHNRIDTDEVVNILGDMKELRVVSLMGNLILKKIRLYRKTMILKCKNLKYLDDRPVFPKDRACAEAWMQGGPEEEAAERKRWIEAEQKKINDSVQALINKRKLYKPVGTSEKEAEDKKKTKEVDEEVATTTTLVCTSNELLNLERKKKSGGSSSSGSSSASSSSDEEVVENAGKEDDGTGQKAMEKSDGRRPMAEDERKALGNLGEEILLPWKTEVTTHTKPKQLIEEMEETKEYVAGDAERKTFGTKILDDQRGSDDPPGGCSVGRELAHYEKLVLETTNETEITPPCSEDKLFKNSSVSCNITDSANKNRNKKGKSIVRNTNDKPACTDILDNYRRKNEPHPLTSQLSSIREDMREFCADVDKFMEDSKLIPRNGDMKRFWNGKEKTNVEIKSDDEGKHEESSGNKGESLKWWNTKERKLKVKEILRKREEESQKSKDTRENIEIVKEDSNERKETSSSQGVYDLLNLKTCPTILLSDMKPCPKNEDVSLLRKSAKKEVNDEDRSSRLFDSLFDEMNRRNDTSDQTGKLSKSISTELLDLEEREKTVEDSAGCSSDRETVKNKSVRIEILEANPVSVLFDDDDEVSESESVKTVINKYEINEQGNVDTNIRKEESLTVDEAQNDTKHLDTRPNDAATSSCLERCQSSKSHKRPLDCEYLDVASKKSHLIEEMDAEGDSSDRKTTSALSEKCRRHFMKEAKKFTKKESPLIDKCIESLITNRNSEGNWKVKCNQEDFLSFTATNVNSDFLSGKTKDNSSEQSHARSKKISENQEIMKESELFSRRQSGK
ncbi:rootletin [Frieseomelitta varia]|uniref:rootletin n=1 Tax=Frieseomelitta varia TaxID=561572 RepID=UPI001CB6A6E8|nr:rootletin [Frieseomelitta varia]